MLTITDYFDASGTHEGSSNVTLAGWVSTDIGWAAFEDRWRLALADYGLSMFHMRKYAHHRDEFEHWSEAQRRIRFAQLAEIITESTRSSLAVCVPVEEFEEEFTPAARAHAGGAYGLAATVMFLEAADSVAERLRPAGPQSGSPMSSRTGTWARVRS